jgi:hypothetical protein
MLALKCLHISLHHVKTETYFNFLCTNNSNIQGSSLLGWNTVNGQWFLSFNNNTYNWSVKHRYVYLIGVFYWPIESVIIATFKTQQDEFYYVNGSQGF